MLSWARSSFRKKKSESEQKDDTGGEDKEKEKKVKKVGESSSFLRSCTKGNTLEPPYTGSLPNIQENEKVTKKSRNPFKKMKSKRYSRASFTSVTMNDLDEQNNTANKPTIVTKNNSNSEKTDCQGNLAAKETNGSTTVNKEENIINPIETKISCNDGVSAVQSVTETGRTYNLNETSNSATCDKNNSNSDSKETNKENTGMSAETSTDATEARKNSVRAKSVRNYSDTETKSISQVPDSASDAPTQTLRLSKILDELENHAIKSIDTKTELQKSDIKNVARTNTDHLCYVATKDTVPVSDTVLASTTKDTVTSGVFVQKYIATVETSAAAPGETTLPTSATAFNITPRTASAITSTRTAVPTSATALPSTTATATAIVSTVTAVPASATAAVRTTATISATTAATVITVAANATGSTKRSGKDASGNVSNEVKSSGGSSGYSSKEEGGLPADQSVPSVDGWRPPRDGASRASSSNSGGGTGRCPSKPYRGGAAVTKPSEVSLPLTDNCNIVNLTTKAVVDNKKHDETANENNYKLDVNVPNFSNDRSVHNIIEGIVVSGDFSNGYGNNSKNIIKTHSAHNGNIKYTLGGDTGNEVTVDISEDFYKKDHLEEVVEEPIVKKYFAPLTIIEKEEPFIKNPKKITEVNIKKEVGRSKQETASPNLNEQTLRELSKYILSDSDVTKCGRTQVNGSGENVKAYNGDVTHEIGLDTGNEVTVNISDEFNKNAKKLVEEQEQPIIKKYFEPLTFDKKYRGVNKHVEAANLKNNPKSQHDGIQSANINNISEQIISSISSLQQNPESSIQNKGSHNKITDIINIHTERQFKEKSLCDKNSINENYSTSTYSNSSTPQRSPTPHNTSKNLTKINDPAGNKDVVHCRENDNINKDIDSDLGALLAELENAFEDFNQPKVPSADYAVDSIRQPVKEAPCIKKHFTPLTPEDLRPSTKESTSEVETTNTKYKDNSKILEGNNNTCSHIYYSPPMNVLKVLDSIRQVSNSKQINPTTSIATEKHVDRTVAAVNTTTEDQAVNKTATATQFSPAVTTASSSPVKTEHHTVAAVKVDLDSTEFIPFSALYTLKSTRHVESVTTIAPAESVEQETPPSDKTEGAEEFEGLDNASEDNMDWYLNGGRGLKQKDKVVHFRNPPSFTVIRPKECYTIAEEAHCSPTRSPTASTTTKITNNTSSFTTKTSNASSDSTSKMTISTSSMVNSNNVTSSSSGVSGTIIGNTSSKAGSNNITNSSNVSGKINSSMNSNGNKINGTISSITTMKAASSNSTTNNSSKVSSGNSSPKIEVKDPGKTGDRIESVARATLAQEEEFDDIDIDDKAETDERLINNAVLTDTVDPNHQTTNDIKCEAAVVEENKDVLVENVTKKEHVDEDNFKKEVNKTTDLKNDKYTSKYIDNSHVTSDADRLTEKCKISDEVKKPISPTEPLQLKVEKKFIGDTEWSAESVHQQTRVCVSSEKGSPVDETVPSVLITVTAATPVKICKPLYEQDEKEEPIPSVDDVVSGTDDVVKHEECKSADVKVVNEISNKSVDAEIKKPKETDATDEEEIISIEVQRETNVMQQNKINLTLRKEDKKTYSKPVIAAKPAGNVEHVVNIRKEIEKLNKQLEDNNATKNERVSPDRHSEIKFNYNIKEKADHELVDDVKKEQDIINGNVRLNDVEDKTRNSFSDKEENKSASSVLEQEVEAVVVTPVREDTPEPSAICDTVKTTESSLSHAKEEHNTCSTKAASDDIKLGSPLMVQPSTQSYLTPCKELLELSESQASNGQGKSFNPFEDSDDDDESDEEPITVIHSTPKNTAKFDSNSTNPFDDCDEDAHDDVQTLSLDSSNNLDVSRIVPSPLPRLSLKPSLSSPPVPTPRKSVSGISGSNQSINSISESNNRNASSSDSYSNGSFNLRSALNVSTMSTKSLNPFDESEEEEVEPTLGLSQNHKIGGSQYSLRGDSSSGAFLRNAHRGSLPNRRKKRRAPLPPGTQAPTPSPAHTPLSHGGSPSLPPHHGTRGSTGAGASSLHQRQHPHYTLATSLSVATPSERRSTWGNSSSSSRRTAPPRPPPPSPMVLRNLKQKT